MGVYWKRHSWESWVCGVGEWVSSLAALKHMGLGPRTQGADATSKTRKTGEEKGDPPGGHQEKPSPARHRERVANAHIPPPYAGSVLPCAYWGGRLRPVRR